jgi:hypothetical protein
MNLSDYWKRVIWLISCCQNGKTKTNCLFVLKLELPDSIFSTILYFLFFKLPIQPLPSPTPLFILVFDGSTVMQQFPTGKNRRINRLKITDLCNTFIICKCPSYYYFGTIQNFEEIISI